MDKLKGAKYFSKFDVQWGYNNVQIQSGDKWKAAFKTNWGLYEPTVMFFGMCNFPATFQAMMDKIFKKEIEGDLKSKKSGMVHIGSSSLFLWADSILCSMWWSSPQPHLIPLKVIIHTPPPLPEMIDGKKEWIVEEILDSKIINRKLHYLVKWKGFGMEHNSWEPRDNIHAPERVADFHQRHPGAACHIRACDFNAIPFCSSSSSAVSGRHSLEGGVDVRGHPIPSRPLGPFL